MSRSRRTSTTMKRTEGPGSQPGGSRESTGSRPWKLPLGALLALAVCLPVEAQVRAEDPGAISQLAWLAGHWVGEAADGTRQEELWLPPAGDVMLGLHRDVHPSGPTFFEYLRIQQSEEGLAYSASPAGKGETTFLAVTVDDRRVVFSNPGHDFPQRILYWLTEDGLHARIEGTVDGQPQSTEWTWHREQ